MFHSNVDKHVDTCGPLWMDQPSFTADVDTLVDALGMPWIRFTHYPQASTFPRLLSRCLATPFNTYPPPEAMLQNDLTLEIKRHHSPIAVPRCGLSPPSTAPITICC